ncbi:uncharacterized protein [Apostichopus japonicus]|uniref:uncharacterized protein isoform X2 n=1 Tax=Stichopus japonicus TaxID=307972 RepID=UPI003AB89945
MSVIWKISILVLCVTVEGGKSALCPRVKSKFCSEIGGLGYEKTFFPNIMDHADQKEAKEAMKPYEELAKTGCSPYIRAFVCASFLPACPVWRDVPKKPQKPCRELCERARKDCEATLLNDLEMEWPAELNCEDFPSHDPSRRNPVCTNFVPPRPVAATMASSVSPEEVMNATDVTETSSQGDGTSSGDCNPITPSAEVSLMAPTDGSGMEPESESTMSPGMDGSTMATAMDGSSMTPGIGGSTMAPGTGGSTMTPDMDGSSMASDIDGSSMAPDMDGSTMTSGIDGSSMAPDMNSSSMASDMKSSSMTPDMDGSTVAPSTEEMLSTESQGTTREPDGLPVIRKVPDNVVIVSGGRAEFHCIAVGATEYSWKRIDGEYPLDKIDMEDFDKVKGAVVRMIDLALEDAGIYACVASNDNGYVEALVTLTVVVAPTIATMTTPQFVSEGDKLVVECKGDGVPPPTILWERKNGGRVKSKGQGTKRLLIIKNAQASDAGIYYCIAVNQAGHANYTVEVEIDSSVEILEEIQPQIIMENETAFFVCMATGNPEPQFSWRRLDGAFPDESRVVIEGPIVNDTLDYPIYTSILGIEPAMGSDTGSYQCYAYNSVGNYTAVGDLIVQGPPGFLQEPEAEQIVSIGDFAYFTCVGSGAPPFNITWSKEGDAEWPSEDSRVVIEDNNTFLRISDVTPDDSGMYVCTISNEMGMKSAVSNLLVEGGSTMSSSSSGVGTDDGEATSMTAGPTEEMKSSVSPSDEEGSTTDDMKSSPSVESGKTDGSTMTGGPSGTQPTPGLDASTEEMQGSAEPSGSPDPMGSPEPSGSPEPMASPEPSGSPEPMASPEPSASPEPMGSPEPSASPEPMASADASSDSMASMGSTATSDPSAPTHGMMDESTMVHKTDMMASGTTKSMVSSSAGHNVDSSMMPTSQSAQVTTPVKPRRTDITNPGTRDLFQGWVDVQGQGAANDFCRIIGTSSDVYQLVCSLAGTEGEEEFNYNSKIGFDIGEKDTFYMKDENGDGRDDYCRCTSVTGKRYVWCTAGGENGFYGNEKVEPDTSQHSFQAEGEKNDLRKCRRRFVDPFFGIPY